MSATRNWVVIIAAMLFLQFPAFVVHGFVVEDYTTLVAEDAGAGDQYGFSVATDGRWLVVGAKYATINGLQAGAVYVYSKARVTGEWQFMQKLVLDNAEAISPTEFGESVAVSNNRILIGARSMIASNGQLSGTAYLYTYRGRKQGWVMDATIEPPDGTDGDEFGRSVALGPHRLFVGARFAFNDADLQSGAVYVYKKKRREWQLETKLTDPNGSDQDQFGRAISFDAKSSKYLAVGSRKGETDNGEIQGKVLIFTPRGKTWMLNQEIVADDGVDGDYFGQSVKLSGNLMIIGARDAQDSEGNTVGAAYIYRLSKKGKSWGLEQKLVPPDGVDKAQYGFAVDFDRQTETNLAVSARRSDSAVEKKTGQVYLYSYDKSEHSWLLDDIVAPEDLAKDDEFGQSLAIDPFGASWLVIGADQSSLSGNDSAGAVYTLSRHDS